MLRSGPAQSLVHTWEQVNNRKNRRISRKRLKRRGSGMYSLSSRQKRQEVREILARAEAANGSTSCAEALRGCEGGSWACDPMDGSVLRNESGESVRTLYTCDHRLCPFCARRRASRMRRNVEARIKEAWPRRKAKLLTLTIDDREGECIDAASGRLQEAWKLLTRRKEWREHVRGGVRSIEVTRNSASGTWHAHIHAVLDADYFDQKSLLSLWRECLNVGEKKGGARIEVARSGVREVVKYIAKGIELVESLTTGELEDFLRWMKGKRLIQCFGNLYGVKLDDDASERKEVAFGWNPKTGEVVKLDLAEWVRVGMCSIIDGEGFRNFRGGGVHPPRIKSRIAKLYGDAEWVP